MRTSNESDTVCSQEQPTVIPDEFYREFRQFDAQRKALYLKACRLTQYTDIPADVSRELFNVRDLIIDVDLAYIEASTLVANAHLPKQATEVETIFQAMFASAQFPEVKRV